MTREEAIELIHDIQTDAVYSILPEEKEALDMAISALSENKGDLISRQVVNEYIDYILSNGMGKKKSFDFIKKFVANLPSVENKGECKECKWFDNERIYNPECENCSRNFNDNFCRSDIRSEREDKE